MPPSPTLFTSARSRTRKAATTATHSRTSIKRLALEPHNALLMRDRAIANRDAGNYDQAVDDYEAAMRLGFSAVDPHPLADLLFFQGRFHQSAQTLQQVIRTRPDNRHASSVALSGPRQSQ